ncbi:urate oxidase [Aldersonia sp. NBC_00410]|uniref:factor-independent urate hydroxylase n=1 Tax=Aldersonia sp. NBC_00410 TaxID=2975954 RepID=UPI0022560E1C|nr:urate oxidase [Aldersonia sp. NBC_00410]MCX5044503.1 urate oxidase [Aldersonia sp. NBC_00410]
MSELTGDIVLGRNQYGKAENRIVRIYRDSARHEIHDINVSSALTGDFADAHLVGDQAKVLPTDTQKNTAYAYAKEKGLLTIEQFGLDLATHYVDDIAPVRRALIELEEYAWERATVNGEEHNHTWLRKGQEVRTASVSVEGTGDEQKSWIVSGFKDLVLLKSTGSEFAGFMEDPYTTLQATHDRVMATALVARWRYTTADLDFDSVYTGVQEAMVERFANLQSLALQQTLYAMGTAVLEKYPFIAEVRMSAPNKHHFLYDFSKFGLDNNNEVFNADDRPYGLIQATVERSDAPDAGPSWATYSVVG